MLFVNGFFTATVFCTRNTSEHIKKEWTPQLTGDLPNVLYSCHVCDAFVINASLPTSYTHKAEYSMLIMA